jgi:hypothetical protein
MGQKEQEMTEVAVLVMLSALAFPGNNERSYSMDGIPLTSIMSVVSGNDSRLVLVDGIAKRTFFIDLPEEAASMSGKLRWEEIGKDQVQPRYELKDAGSRFVQVVSGSTKFPARTDWFKADMSRVDRSRFEEKAQSEGGSEAPRKPIEDRLMALYSWQVVAGDKGFAYGALDSGAKKNPNNDWYVPFKLGFFTFDLEHPNKAPASTWKGQLVYTSRHFDYYVTSLPFIAAAPGSHDVYFLEMSTHADLYYVNMRADKPSAVLVPGLPGGEVSLPLVDVNSQGFAAYTQIELHGDAMPYGLFADMEQRETSNGLADVTVLYLLRRPASTGADWTMTKLLPEPDLGMVTKLGEEVSLGSADAKHLAVHFTPTSILLFEKSSVDEQSGEQTVDRLRVLPRNIVDGNWRMQ